jgi:hypothetical protein
VPIFLDCGIAPVFMGHALIGEKMPNLTYMTVYDDDAALGVAWGNFVKHPDWQVLKEVKRYQGIYLGLFWKNGQAGYGFCGYHFFGKVAGAV